MNVVNGFANQKQEHSQNQTVKPTKLVMRSYLCWLFIISYRHKNHELCLLDNMNSNSIGIGDNCLQRHNTINSNGLLDAYWRWADKLALEIQVSINKVRNASNQDFYHILVEEISRYSFYILVLIWIMPVLFWVGFVFGYIIAAFISKPH